MRQLSRYHTLHVVMREMREMRIWPQYAAKCCKNAGKFFPDVILAIVIAKIVYLGFLASYTSGVALII
jgi:hypothetical protein